MAKKQNVETTIVSTRKKKPPTTYKVELDDKMHVIPIVQNGPIPKHTFPLDTMEMGQSFTVLFSECSRNNVSNKISKWRRENKSDKRFITRVIKQEQATRIWRIA